MAIASARSFVLVIVFTQFHFVSASIIYFLSSTTLHCCSVWPCVRFQFVDQLACDVNRQAASAPVCPVARPRRICSRTLADASSLPYSSCQFHHSYGGV